MRPADRRFMAALATSRSAGRTTSSTNRVVKVSPSGSARMRDRSLAERGVGSKADSSAHRRARMIARSPKAHRSSGQRRALALWWDGVGTAAFAMRRPPGVDVRRILGLAWSANAGHAQHNSRRCEGCWFVHRNARTAHLCRHRITPIRSIKGPKPQIARNAHKVRSQVLLLTYVSSPDMTTPLPHSERMSHRSFMSTATPAITSCMLSVRPPSAREHSHWT